MVKNPFEDPGPSSASLRTPAASGLAEASLGAKLGSAGLRKLPLRHFAGSILMYVVSLALLALALGLALPADKNLVGAAVSGAFAVVFAIVPTVLLLRRGKAALVTLHEHGFVVSRGSARKAIRYAAIESFTLVDKEQLDNGRPVGRVIRIAVRGGDGAEKLDHFSPIGTADPTLPAIGRLVSAAADAAAVRIRSGRALTGKGWRLGPEGLVDLRRKAAAPIPLAKLAAVAPFDKDVAIWRAGDEAPAFRVAAGSPNAALLRELATHAVDASAASPSGGLGRLLVEKKPSKVIAFAILLVAISLLGASTGPFFDPTFEVGLAACLGVGGLLAAWAALALGFWKVRFHERGFVKSSPFGATELAYSDVRVFGFAATRNYHNGAYTGTTTNVSFRSAEGKKVSFSVSSRGTDDDLDFIREAVGGIVAGTLLRELDRAGSVDWGSSLRITKKTVEVVPAMLRKARTLPIEALGLDIKDGWMSLYAPGEKKAAATLVCSAPNFWPGLLVLQHLAAESAPKEPAPAPTTV